MNIWARTLAVLAFLVAGVIARADTLLVVYSEANQVEKISSSGADLGVFTTTGLNNPQGIACDLSGNVYVANAGNNTITKYAADGTFLGLFESGGLSQAEGLALDNAGNLYVADFANDTVARFSTVGVNLGNFVGTGDGPWALAFDPQGNLYITMFYGGGIVRYSASGVYLGSLAVQGGGPRGLAFDKSGNFYVVSYYSQHVEKYGANGQNLGPLVLSGLGGVDGLCIDSGGNLYICDGGNNQIHKVSPTGQDLGVVFSTGANTNPMQIVDLTAAQGGPIIANQPTPLTITAGQNAVFTSGASGLGLSYQWQFNGANLTNNATVAGANTTTLTVTAVTAANAGNYTFLVSNGAGNTSSLPAPLQVNPVAAPGGPPYFLVACNSADVVQAISANGQLLGAFTNSNLSAPMGIATDAGGNAYVVNNTNHTIEKYSPTGQDLGPFASANLTDPRFDAFDMAGNLYVTDAGGNIVVRFAPNGAYLGVFASTLGSPRGLAFDTTGNLYVAEWGGAVAVEKFSANGTNLGTFVAESPSVANALGVAFDRNGNLYVSSLGAFNLSKFSPSGVPLGQVKVAGLNYPESMCFDAGGNLYLCDSVNMEIHKISPADQDLGIWANLQITGHPNAIVAAPFTALTVPVITQQPATLTVTAGQNAVFTGNASGLGLYYQWQFNGANLTNNATVSGVSTTTLTLAGVTAGNVGNYTLVVSNTGGAVATSPALLQVNPVPSPSTPPIFLVTMATGNVTEAYSSNGQDLGSFAATNLSSPQGIVADAVGNWYVVNQSSHTIEKFSPAGRDLGSFISSNLTSPESVVLDALGNFYVTDSGTNTVVRFSPTGAYLGVFATTQSGPWGVAFDATGNLYVSDQGANVVEKFSGNGTNLGVFASKNVDRPTGVAFDRNGNLYVTNQVGLSNTIEKFSPAGVDLGPIPINNGGGSSGLFFDAGGNLYVCFSGNNTFSDYIFKISPTDQFLGTFVTISPSYVVGTPKCIIAAPFAKAPAPGIVQPPSALSINAGQTALFTASGYGLGLSYQWQLNGANLTDSATIAGANTTTLTLTGVTAANAGNYTLLVGNGGGTAASASANLQVQAAPPAETMQTFLVSCEGSNVLEGVTSTGQDLGPFATSGLSYPQGLAQDAQGNTYVVNAGSSSIEKFSPAGADLGPLTSGNLSNPISIALDAAGNLYVTDSGTNTVVRFSPTGAYLGVFATTQSGPWGLAFDATGNLYVSDQGANVVEKFSGNGTNLGVFASSNVARPTGLAFDRNGNLYVASQWIVEIDKFSPTGLHLGTLNISGLSNPAGMFFDRAGYLYVCDTNISRVHKISPADQDLGLLLSLKSQSGPVSIVLAPIAPPIINRQPFPLTVNTGQAAQFSVLNNVVSANFQWQLNGANLTDGGAVTGSNTTILHLSSVNAASAGNYTVLIWNAAGSATSTPALLTVNPAPPPVGPEVFLATLSNNNVVEAYTSSGQDLGPFATGNLSNPQGLAFDQQGNLYVVNHGLGTVEEFSPTGADLGPLTTWNINQPVQDALDTSGNIYVASAQLSWIYWFSPNRISSGPFAWTEGYPWGLAFDAHGNLFVTDQISNVVQELSSNGTNLGVFASTNLQQPTGLAFDRNGNLYVASQGTRTVEKFSAAGEDLGPLTITGLGAPNGLMFDSGGNLYICDSTNSTIHKVSPADGDLGVVATTPTAAASLALMPFAPSASQQPEPASQTVFAGDPAQFSVSAIGFDPAYQWRFNGTNLTDGGGVSGSNTSTLRLSAVTLADAGNYSVLITTAGGNLASSPGILQVDSPPFITVQPEDVLQLIGEQASFSVTAKGTGVLAYQWQLNGKNLSRNATAANYTVTRITAAYAGNYTVTVTNAFGNVTSAPAALSIGAAPKITTSPANSIVTAGSNTTAVFKVVATGTPVPTIQWQISADSGTTWTNITGGNFSGFTTTNLTVSNITGNLSGTQFRAVASNLINGTTYPATSKVATLTVDTPAAIANLTITANGTTNTGNVTVSAGQNVTFTVTATGTPPPTYQWLLNGVNIKGAIKATYTIAKTAATSAGNYSISVTNAVTKTPVTGGPFTLTVLTSPAIVTPLKATSAKPTTNPMLKVVAGGNPVPTFSWTFSGCTTLPNNISYSNTTNISPAISILNFTNATISDTGTYKVIITNGQGTPATSSAKLTVK